MSEELNVLALKREYCLMLNQNGVIHYNTCVYEIKDLAGNCLLQFPHGWSLESCKQVAKALENTLLMELKTKQIELIPEPAKVYMRPPLNNPVDGKEFTLDKIPEMERRGWYITDKYGD
tara:strand:- start:233 stop:589 length:357 start_codon:yes stop_codon:yes gene_type:complete